MASRFRRHQRVIFRPRSFGNEVYFSFMLIHPVLIGVTFRQDWRRSRAHEKQARGMSTAHLDRLLYREVLLRRRQRYHFFRRFRITKWCCSLLFLSPPLAGWYSSWRARSTWGVADWPQVLLRVEAVLLNVFRLCCWWWCRSASRYQVRWAPSAWWRLTPDRV